MARAYPDASYRKVWAGPPTPEDLHLGIRVRAAGRRHIVRAPVDFDRQDGLLLRYGLSGSGRIDVGGRQHLLTRGAFHLAWPGNSQIVDIDPRGGIEYFWVDFDGSVCSHLCRSAGFTPQTPVVVLVWRPDFLELFERLYAVVAAKGLLHLHDAAAVLMQLLLAIRRARYESLAKLPARFAAVSYQARSLDEVVAAAGCSKSHFIHSFKELTGISPWKYILSLKVERARELILQEKLSIGAIAESLGFEDQLYFSRLFRKHTGLSPRKYRQAARQSPET